MRPFTFMRHSVPLILTLLMSCQAFAAGSEQAVTPQEMRQLMQVAEYIGVDYSEAVAEGEIINAGEYEEMEEFSQLLLDTSARLGKSTAADAIRTEARALQAAIQSKSALTVIKGHTARLRHELLSLAPALSLPQSLLEEKTVAALYQDNCAACHGEAGMGDGPLAAQLDPPPINFHDRERAENRSLLGLYDAISEGLEGTSMGAFLQLSEQQRWSLAFYVGGMAFDEAPAAGDNAVPLSLEELVMFSPQVLQENKPELAAEAIAALRADPTPLFKAQAQSGAGPIDYARTQLQSSLTAYQQGDYAAARTQAISAYLDGFELAESALDSHSPALRQSIERDLLAIRGMLNKESAPAVVEAQVSAVLERLAEAEEILAGETLSGTAVFVASLLILLREGLEALLVVIALTTILIKTGRNDAVRYVHLGWIGAFAAGLLTWLAAQHLVTISGASREIMEGVAAMLAAAVLFYVGFWMHSKTHADHWQQYIRERINRSLSSGALWGIAGLAFIAVYREIFETILFYQALATQTGTGQASALWGGFAAAVALLAVFGWAMVRYSARLPIGKFFSVTTVILLGLSFVLAGKAVAALQEAALIPITALPVSFSFDWLGIYPTWQGIALQLAILAAAAWLWFGGRKPVPTDSAPA
ncbi:Ferrous iron permease EfeU precursor [Microbulbifer aggregans]|uniref:Ferrous iron permease EfeU n=1 Tax=Microbulbifer aggregans TaxID=1769779 RepID=A0A1C9W6Y0_9GAMM|nr:cytochrome c/FTR1 family iron permease [Microbulbifer aggregans]AOS96914.1 Ferrous iron permease EfeU precursor [Microbulbifer aggregans]